MDTCKRAAVVQRSTSTDQQSSMAQAGSLYVHDAEVLKQRTCITWTGSHHNCSRHPSRFQFILAAGGNRLQTSRGHTPGPWRG
eukprot:364639-Chlamydomonas_euryale.AAC.49